MPYRVMSMICVTGLAVACSSDESTNGTSPGSGGQTAQGDGGPAATGGSGGSATADSGTGGSPGAGGAGGAGGAASDAASGTGGAAGGAEGGGGAPALITPQSMVQDEAGIECAGETVSPSFTSAEYPCDSTMTAAEIRTVFADAMFFKLLAGDWAASSLGGTCATSTLCGQQHDPSLLLINDPSFASMLDPIGAFNIPGINIDPGTSNEDLLLLAYNCIRNFPQGYLLGTPAIPTVAPIIPQDDVRTGEFLLWANTDPVVYRGRLEVAIDALGGTINDPLDVTAVFPSDGAFQEFFFAANAIFDKVATGTGPDVSVELAASGPTGNFFEAVLTVQCMQPDVDINP